MTERPILFSAPMVRAILAGAKTQTRRAISVQPPPLTVGVGRRSHPDPRPHWCAYTREGPPDPHCFLAGCEIDADWWHPCPYGQPGDRLWVREAWRTVAEADALPPRDLTPAHRIWHEASTPHQPGAGRYRPPMFMPRWASRITLEITGVRVERLQAISDEDAMAEGAEPRQPVTASGIYIPGQYRMGFRDLWESISGTDSWAANPWVWVVAFKRVEAA